MVRCFQCFVSVLGSPVLRAPRPGSATEGTRCGVVLIKVLVLGESTRLLWHCLCSQ